MKVVFVCKNNTARSQVAMEFYNRLANEPSTSAGIAVEEPKKLVKDRPAAATIIQVMKEYGIDISNNRRVQLTQDSVADTDKIIVMAEPQLLPEWLSKDPRVIYWQVSDPKGQPIEKVRQTRDQILEQVYKMLGYNKEEALAIVE